MPFGTKINNDVFIKHFLDFNPIFEIELHCVLLKGLPDCRLLRNLDENWLHGVGLSSDPMILNSARIHELIAKIIFVIAPSLSERYDCFPIIYLLGAAICILYTTVHI